MTDSGVRSLFSAQLPYTVGGREAPFAEDEEGRYVAMIEVVLSHRSPRAYRDDYDGLKCVAERAVHAAAGAYNFHDTRLVSVSLVAVERQEPE